MTFVQRQTSTICRDVTEASSNLDISFAQTVVILNLAPEWYAVNPRRYFPSENMSLTVLVWIPWAFFLETPLELNQLRNCDRQPKWFFLLANPHARLFKKADNHIPKFWLHSLKVKQHHSQNAWCCVTHPGHFARRILNQAVLTFGLHKQCTASKYASADYAKSILRLTYPS